MRTLFDWRLREVVRPSLAVNRDGKHEEGYTYADLTIIRLIRELRADRIDFKSATRAHQHMYERLGPPSAGWSGQKVYFLGRSIFVEGQDEWPITDATQLGQTVAVELFGNLVTDLRDLADGESIIIPKQFRPYVAITPDVMGGEPVVRGTRLPTAVLSDLLRAGTSVTALVRTYGRLIKPQFIRKGIEYEHYLDSLQAA